MIRSLILGAILSLLFIQTCHATTLNELASEIAGQEVQVHCVTPNGEWGGLGFFVNGKAEPEFWMDGTYCGALNNALHPTARTQHWLRTFNGAEQVGWGLHTLVHESLHIRMNSTNEGLVECTSYRNDYRFAKLLGLNWKVRNAVYRAARRDHLSNHYKIYRTVC